MSHSPSTDDEDHCFDAVDAGCSLTYPLEAGAVKKGGHIMIKGHPCKVTSLTTVQNGKHGHAKVHFVALDIFTGKKMEDIVSSAHSTTVPFVARAEQQLINIDGDGFLTLMDDAGELHSDKQLPAATDADEKLAAEITERFEAEEDILVTVVSACGTEQVMGWRRMLD